MGEIINTSIIKIQSMTRMFILKNRYKKLLLQILLEYKSSIIIQNFIRKYHYYNQYKKVKYVVMFVQKISRGIKIRRIFSDMLLEKRSIKLQSYIRMLIQYNKYNNIIKPSILKIQTIYRMYKSKLILIQSRLDAKNFDKILCERNKLQEEKLIMLQELYEELAEIDSMCQNKIIPKLTVAILNENEELKQALIIKQNNKYQHKDDNEKSYNTSKPSVFVVAVDDKSNEEVIYQLYNNDDYIRDAVRNHMEEFSKQQALLSNNQRMQKERLKKQSVENKKNKQEVSYPAMTCGLGGLFSSFMKSTSGNVSSGQSVC